MPDGDLASDKGAQQPPLSAHVCCGQTARWIKMPRGLDSGLDPGHIVLDGAPSPRGTVPQCSAHVCCGQTAGWINMPLDREVDLGPGDIVLDGDPAAPQGAQPPIFGPCLLWPNGRMDLDATWYRFRSRPKRHCVRWGPSSQPPKGAQPPIFGPRLLWPNGRPSQLLLSICCIKCS